ncbi:glycosyl transferase [Ectothiorhodospira haloalkaliphila]|uniref:Glycosyl transferase n=1 Tax=Ectothiorhodospira haloalkaliphila TaxID=421628 RepID=W8KKU1_9GAMM|nr:glycosyltransferase family 4 protein [Ectothiorhodospira haloalkaliphila]AHK79778.1 glycosyl transferase [Ectothiorhodospira haloalkaliphila]
MRVVVANTQIPFVSGGAESHADNLVQALRRGGHQAELVTLPFKWYPAEVLLDQILMARLVSLDESTGEPVDRLIGLRFPAYLIPHPNKVLWVIHQYRTAYELWDHPDFGDLFQQIGARSVRDAIAQADRQYIPEARAVFANSANVASRMRHFCDVESKPLYHPPPHAEELYCKPAEGFLFFPSRVNAIKRQSLVIRALSHCKQDVKVFFAGAFESTYIEKELKALSVELGVSHRVRWLGSITEMEKLDFYARCLGVVFPPYDEDYGYVTLEAMLASKPVVTTQDAGGPLEFVEHEVTGLVAEPEPVALAQSMDTLWSDFSRAARWGRDGREAYLSRGISWDHVVSTLLA